MSEMMDLQELAQYLNRDARELSRMAERGQLPGHKVSGDWRFNRAEISQWIESQLHGYSEAQLTDLESQTPVRDDPQLVITPLLSQASIQAPLPATTKPSVLRELVGLAEHTGHIYDPDAILQAIRQREELRSTAVDQGVAIPHPRRPLPAALGESVIAYGRTASGIPFGASRGALTDIFFLVCCRDERTHLGALARLSRLLMRPGFVERLREASTPAEIAALIETAERELSGG
jgi:PTS system nitrogen regulatory IIA component